jgi:hypothetical protein
VPSLRHVIGFLMFALASHFAHASFQSWTIDEAYSNADGTVQYIVLKESQGKDGANNLAGVALLSTHSGFAKSWIFGLDLPGTSTANRRVLIATQALAASGLIAPDYVMPDRFLATDEGSVQLAGVSSLGWANLPTDGADALFAMRGPAPNVATNFSGQSVSVPASATMAIEFYNADQDHYFMSPLAPDIDALDSGRIAGWARTGFTFQVYPSLAVSAPGADPVCRFYIPPEHGNSHFFSASQTDCAAILQSIPTNPSFSGYVYETPNAFYIAVPDSATGTCAAGTIPVYRLWNARFDSNHRFTVDPAVKTRMLAKGYVAEGFGPDHVSMCASAVGQPDPLFRATASSPFAPGCDGVAASGVVYANAEVKPMVAVNPKNTDNIVGVWQQDRWSNGGARGSLTGYSLDGGRTWARTAPTFSRCAGGNAANGGDYERATDPWVTFAPDGTAYQSALAIKGQSPQPGSASAVLVSRSTDGGRTWSGPVTVIRDGPAAFNDKSAITADATDARYVYATWDRLEGNRGPSYMSRTTDGGATWEPPRAIFDPGAGNQTINNQIVVLPDGTLINFFSRLTDKGNGTFDVSLAILRSPDKGMTWSPPIIIVQAFALGVKDPENGTDVRDSATLGSIAVSRQGMLVAVWQDSRFSAGTRDGIALSRSTDGGVTWSAPVGINAHAGVQAFSPTVAVRDDGTIGVTYYDFRNNTADPTTLLTDLWLTRSTDGVTWRERHVSGPFDLSLAPYSSGLFLGDYHALAGIGTAFVPFFVQANNGNAGNRTDVFASLVAAAGATPTSAKSQPAESDAPILALSAPSLNMTTDLQHRLREAVRRVLARRVPGGDAGALETPVGPP